MVCYVGTEKYNLPTCDIGSVDDHVVDDKNIFSGLEVEDNGVEITSEEARTKLGEVDNDTMAGDCHDEGSLKPKKGRKS